MKLVKAIEGFGSSISDILLEIAKLIPAVDRDIKVRSAIGKILLNFVSIHERSEERSNGFGPCHLLINSIAASSVDSVAEYLIPAPAKFMLNGSDLFLLADKAEDGTLELTITGAGVRFFPRAVSQMEDIIFAFGFTSRV